MLKFWSELPAARLFLRQHLIAVRGRSSRVFITARVLVLICVRAVCVGVGNV